MDKELNKSLLKAITKKQINLNEIEELLIAGADPLGPIAGEEDTCTLEEMFCEASTSMDHFLGRHRNPVREYMPELVGLFIKHGMKPDSIEASNHGMDDEHLTLWCMTFCCSQEAIETLRLLIEHNLNIKALEDFIGHFYEDVEMVDGSDIDEQYQEYLTNGFKMIMLSASYSEVLEKSIYIRSCIEADSTNSGNEYDLTKFRDTDRYEYSFDTSTCTNIPHGLLHATVEIREKGSDQVIWKMYV